MKRSFIAIAISIMVSAAAVGCTSIDLQESGATDTEITQETTEEMAQEAGAEQTTEETTNEASDETATSEESDAATSEYAAVVDKLLASEAVTPDNEDILSTMARCVTLSGIIKGYDGEFSKADNLAKAYFRYEILKELSLTDSPLREKIELRTGKSSDHINLEDAKEAFKDIYGEDNFVPDEKLEKVEDGYLLFYFGDGETATLIYHPRFFEDDKYILLTGAMIYGATYGEGAFHGYADILFTKNPDSRLGVTLLYGRYRDSNIKVASVSTSSELAASGGKSYSGSNLIDGDYSTAWCEGVKGGGVGETITLKLEKKELVSGIQICNGYDASYDLYNSNGVLTNVKVDFGNGKTKEDDICGYAHESYSPESIVESNLDVVELDEPVETDTITIKITGAKEGAKYEDTCVSEITVF